MDEDQIIEQKGPHSRQLSTVDLQLKYMEALTIEKAAISESRFTLQRIANRYMSAIKRIHLLDHGIPLEDSKIDLPDDAVENMIEVLDHEGPLVLAESHPELERLLNTREQSTLTDVFFADLNADGWTLPDLLPNRESTQNIEVSFKDDNSSAMQKVNETVQGTDEIEITYPDDQTCRKNTTSSKDSGGEENISESGNGNDGQHMKDGTPQRVHDKHSDDVQQGNKSKNASGNKGPQLRKKKMTKSSLAKHYQLRHCPVCGRSVVHLRRHILEVHMKKNQKLPLFRLEALVQMGKVGE